MDGERSITAEMHEYFGAIITRLDGIEDYEKELNEGSNGLLGSGTNEINTLPYGKTSGCHNILVVIIDGKTDIDQILNMALKHLGINCKNITKYVLFYIANDYAKWNLLWSLYKPSFDALKDKYGVRYFMHFKNTCNIDLEEIKNDKLKCFKYISKPSDDVSDLLIYSITIEDIVYKMYFVKSYYYLTFHIKAQLNINKSKSPDDDKALFNSIKSKFFSGAKGDIVIGMGDDHMQQLSYKQVILNKQELNTCLAIIEKLRSSVVGKGGRRV
jgi:hypothetical protein